MDLIEIRDYEDDICGEIDIRGSTEFICTLPPHDIGDKKDQHYFVNRWPNRNPHI